MKINTYIQSLISRFALIFFILQCNKLSAQTPLPVPDHVVVLIIENHAESQLVGSTAAPYINSIINSPATALFIHSYGIEHPSQPNYLDLYAGCNQGVTTNNVPTASPFTTPNLGRQLLDSGRTFITYSEGLPSVGYNGSTSGAYVRKHNPVANWMGTGLNQVPLTCNQPFTAFPTDFTLLPTVSYVVPDLINDMHDGTDPSRITTCDTWINNKLGDYIEWAKTHNSLLILTCDEDDNNNSNRILTFITGLKVKGGTYTDTITHYNILRTIEDFYRLPYACNASTALPLTSCWKTINTGGRELNDANFFDVYPNPTNGILTIHKSIAAQSLKQELTLTNLLGELVYHEFTDDFTTKEIQTINTLPGIYFIKLSNGTTGYTKKIIIY